MSAGERTSAHALARDGFGELGDADRLLTELPDVSMAAHGILGADGAADPDAALGAGAHRTP
jgi:glutamate-ammonia-ligase adenylyltransferase